MDSPLGPALANIFVGYYEEKLFSEISKPAVYFRYVDDTFVIFRNEKESEEFLSNGCMIQQMSNAFGITYRYTDQQKSLNDKFQFMNHETRYLGRIF